MNDIRIGKYVIVFPKTKEQWIKDLKFLALLLGSGILGAIIVKYIPLLLK
jgi:hypothetical protein